ncbi:radical SAM/SPASM domain-containing protein [Bariatricus sp. HCP28S3_A7]|uniref:radical SAM protein n=1 Tax=Bariatricus sp. HCP28S3_A7 TaxID=3438894 RepID=UPI003F8956CB
MRLEQCIITLTRNCNLRCDFCYAKRTGYMIDDTIKKENVKRIIDFCNDAKVKFVVFSGGEPMMYPELAEMIRYVKSCENKMTVAIATNGIILSDYEFCKHLVECGLDYIDISLKGKNEEECLAVVGQECFEKQLQAIRNVSSLKVDFTCSMVLTISNVDGFCQAIEAAYDNGARQFSFTFALDNEDSEKKNLEYLKNNNPYDVIDRFLEQKEELNAITKGEWWVEYTFPICIYTEHHLKELKGKLAAPCQIYKGNGITFDTGMNILPCSMFIDDKIGRFGDDFNSYEEFKRYANTDLYKRIIDEISKMPSKECEHCEYLKDCYGGCPIFWKNCDYNSLMSFKKAYMLNKQIPV